jgi:poly-gamma-glutamate capsule biosynthesis protein CapA/YwtB (metallophosphatase superfamily)
MSQHSLEPQKNLRPQQKAVVSHSSAACEIEWSEGRCHFPPLLQERDIRVTIASDWAPIRAYEELAASDPLAVYGDLLPIFRDSDLNIVNVECALCRDGEPILKAGPALRADPDRAVPLAEVPFHLACLANNHTGDYGVEGLRQTMQALRHAGLATIGAGETGQEAARPHFFSRNGTTLAVLNFAEGEACASVNGGPGAAPFDLEIIEEQIREAKRHGNAVLAIFHGGREHAPLPPPYVIDGLRRLARAGADAVVGHHPHVPQGIEIHHGTPIAYSQGNFVFFKGEGRYFQSVGYLVHLDFSQGALSALSITPYRMRPNGVDQLSGEERNRFLSILRRVSSYLAEPAKISEAWDAFIDEMGEEGLKSPFASLLQLFEKEPRLAAARMHNRFFTPAHRELYLRGLKRAAEGRLGDSPEWARQLVREWAT